MNSIKGKNTKGILILFSLLTFGCASAPSVEADAFIASVVAETEAKEREAARSEQLDQIAAQINRLTDAVMLLLDQKREELEAIQAAAKAGGQ